MKLWCLKSPRGKLVERTLGCTRSKAWDMVTEHAQLPDGMGLVWSESCQEWRLRMQRAGYRVVRVEVREVTP